MISVIVPVYNGEKFLHRCVESILSQTYGDLEIVLVDDGSTDDSANICDGYAVRYDMVRAVHRVNGGLSAARNTGMDEAKGDFYVFVDSDDEMMPTMIEELNEAYQKTGADICICDFYEIIDGESKSGSKEALAKAGTLRTYEGEAKLEQLIDNNLITTVQWNKLFKKEIFRDIRYPEGKYHEDEFVIHHQLAAANAVTYLERKLYLYHRHSDSITWNPTGEKAYNILEAYRDRIGFFANKDQGLMAGKSFNLYRAYKNNLLVELDGLEDGREWKARILDIIREIDADYSKYYQNLPLNEKIAAGAFSLKYRAYMTKEKYLKR